MIYTPTICAPDAVSSVNFCETDFIEAGIWGRQEEVWQNVELFWGNWVLELGGDNCG